MNSHCLNDEKPGENNWMASSFAIIYNLPFVGLIMLCTLDERWDFTCPTPGQSIK